MENILPEVMLKATIFLSLFIVLAWLFKKHTKRNSGYSQKKKLSIIERCGLNQNVGLALVSYAGKEHLVSYSQQNIELLFSEKEKRGSKNEEKKSENQSESLSAKLKFGSVK